MEKSKFDEAVCPICGHKLREITDNNDYEGEREFKCDNCGELVLLDECIDEELNSYPFYNDEVKDSVKNESHGYEGLCPKCGHHIIWGADFMRSEVIGDVDEDDTDEKGCPKGDSLAASVSCPHCGSQIYFVEPKPSELKDYPYYSDSESEDGK